MGAAAGESEHDVPRANRFAVDDGRFFHCTDGKSGQVIVAVRVHAWHFSGFATNQRALRELATACNAADDPGRNLDTYAASLGLGDTLADFAAAARARSRLAWDPALTAPAAAAWLREGYGVE